MLVEMVFRLNTQRYGLSTKVLERAHQIPERFDNKLINSLRY